MIGQSRATSEGCQNKVNMANKVKRVALATMKFNFPLASSKNLIHDVMM